MPRPSKGNGRNKPHPWSAPPPSGPTVAVDVDGVVASMAQFEHLVSAKRYKDRDWKAFHRNFGNADLIKPGARLIRDLHAAGLQVSWTTTRLDQFAAPTYGWIKRRELPLGHLQTRSLFKDGTARGVIDVKRRHWWRWCDKFPDSPLVAWIDDDENAVEALRGEGCPAWLFTDIFEHVKAGDLMAAIAAGPEPVAVLNERARAARPVWEQAENEYQDSRADWRRRHKERMKQRQAEQRRRG